MFPWLNNHYHIGIFENRVAVFDPKSGTSAERTANVPFSTDALLVAEADVLERELNALIRNTFSWKARLFQYPVIEVVHLGRPVSELEKQAIRKAVWNVGARKAILPGEA